MHQWGEIFKHKHQEKDGAFEINSSEHIAFVLEINNKPVDPKKVIEPSLLSTYVDVTKIKHVQAVFFLAKTSELLQVFFLSFPSSALGCKRYDRKKKRKHILNCVPHGLCIFCSFLVSVPEVHAIHQIGCAWIPDLPGLLLCEYLVGLWPCHSW